MADCDALDWIFAADEPTDLARRYDQWAATYDDDHEAWGWRGPTLVAQAALRWVENGVLLDAGCGTGRAGIALRHAGWSGQIIGVDLSAGMLAVAAETEAYDQLVRCSLDALPVGARRVAGVVSSGVFTHGHVGGAAFAELCDAVRPSGVIAVTQRLDLSEFFAPDVTRLTESGTWSEVERSEPLQLHPDRDGLEQQVITWQVR